MYKKIGVVVFLLAGTAFSGNIVAQESGKSEAELEALYWARIDSAKMVFSDADVKFMTGMIGHHAQALVMSALAPDNGASPTIRTLTARIINAQKDEIKTMQNWLRERGQPVPEVHIDGLKLMIHMSGAEKMNSMDHGDEMDGGMMDHGEGHADHTNMPGMLTQEQLVELSEAKGVEFDKLFLKYMIQHHNGAIIMVRELVATDGAMMGDATFKIATEINVDQITEIERMKLMLRELEESTGDL